MKEAKTEDDATVECLAGMVAEAVDYTGKALVTVTDAMQEHEPEPEMVLKRLRPTAQQEARMSDVLFLPRPAPSKEPCRADGS